MSAFDSISVVKIVSGDSRPRSELIVSRAATTLPSNHHRRSSRPYQSSAAILTPMIVAGLLYLVNPHAAMAQAGAASDLPPVVIADPGKKPKREVAKRVVSKRAVASRGVGRTNQPVQEAPVAGAGDPTPAEAALDRVRPYLKRAVAV